MRHFLLTLLLTGMAVLSAFAGVDNLNYQAIIRENNTPVANKQVSLRLQLVQYDKVGYTETATVTTDDNGLIRWTIGTNRPIEGINWEDRQADVTLRVAVDLGDGTWRELSDSGVSSVPTALYALKSGDTDKLYAETTYLHERVRELSAFQDNFDGAMDKVVEDLTVRLEEQLKEIEIDETLLAGKVDKDDYREFVLSIQAELGACMHFIDQLENGMDNLKATIQANHNDFFYEIERLQESDQHTGEDISNLREDVLEIGINKIGDLQSQLAWLQDVVKEYTEYTMEYSEGYQQIRNDLWELEERVGKLESDGGTGGGTNPDLANEVELIKTDVQSLKAEAYDHSTKIEVIQTHIAELFDEMERRNAWLDRLQREVSETRAMLESEIVDLQAKVESDENIINAMQVMIAELRREIDELKK